MEKEPVKKQRKPRRKKAKPVFVYSATHAVYYNTEQPVPIDQVIAALQALEGLLKDVPRVVEGLTKTEIHRSEIFVEKIESGSLTEKVFIKFFFKDQEGLDRFIEKISENKVMKNTIIAVALGALATYGVMWASSMMKGSAPNITANNNVIINIGAGEVKMTPEEFRAVVEAAVINKQATAKNALKFIEPARLDPNSTVQIQGADLERPLVITKESISEAPKKLDLPRNELIEDIKEVEVHLRASDMDSKKTGWAGSIPGITDRVKIELDPVVSEAEIFGKTKIMADVTLISTIKSGAREYAPSTIFIRKIH